MRTYARTIGRRLFAGLTEDMSPAEARRARADMLHAAAALGLVLLAWLVAVWLTEAHQAELQQARDDAALHSYAEARRRAQVEAEAHWLPQVVAAYEQGLYDECERQRLARRSTEPCMHGGR